jgi:Phosphomannose isomerase
MNNTPGTSSSSAPRGLVLLPQNRVWRSYTGGRTLDALAGLAAPTDGPFPEDWIGSTTRAINPPNASRHAAPRPALPPEGVSEVLIAGAPHDLAALIAADPEYFLGAAHVAKFGARPMLLVKFLDSAIRLHFQVHPTAAFAQQFLHSPSGKTEAYHVLSVRDDGSTAEPTGYIYLGFQRPPSRDALRRMIETQDLAALEACFDKIPVQPGDTYIVPGGVPHALGAGVFLVEIQEPSDLVVRFEFTRAGITLPESARFMGRDLEFCLDVFDLTPWPLSRVAVEAACPPKRRRALGPDSWQDDLVDASRTPCFRVRRARLGGEVVKNENSFHIGIVTAGSVTVTAAGERHRLSRFDKFLVPAGLGPLHYAPEGTAEILECYPPES